MTKIQRTRSMLTEAQKHLTMLEKWLNECESALMNGEMIDQCGLRPARLEDVTYLVEACADQKARIDRLYLQLAIQERGHDWESIKALAKVIKIQAERQ